MKNTKQTSKHTAGEWKIEYSCGDIVSIGPISANADALDSTDLRCWLDINEIDARLIASAPLMLEALEAVLPLVQELADGGTACNVQLCKIKEALVRAKGE